jgi:asparagine synthase (glutamine-hydrolysing)
MCGILGAATVGDAPVLEGVRRGLAGLRHRGPEAMRTQVFSTDHSAVVLGHTRLRIIDTTESADQPLGSEDGSIQVVFNGELYNFGELRSELEQAGHRFATATDTEVLVHLYEHVDGDPNAMLERLRGMFAFALFDTVQGRLLLARDRLGIKPLYHAAISSGIAFASEATALIRSELVAAMPDTTSTIGYLLWGSVQGPRTMFAGIEELVPGSFLLWDGGVPKIERWWQPSFRPDLEGREAIDHLRSGLEDSVGRHLVADREVGVFLSGGADSGSIASIAARSGGIRSLTVTYPEVGGDEGPAAASVAIELGLHHEEVAVLGSEVAEWLPAIVRGMDQPTHDGVNSWVVSKAAHDAGLVVALSGVGGDELFGGYPTFSQVPRVHSLARLLSIAPQAVRRRLSDALVESRPGARSSRVLMAGPGMGDAYRTVRGLFSVRDLETLGALRWIGEGEAIDASTPDDPSLDDPRDAVASLEIGRYLRNQLLRDTDMMSMAHSLEVRVPLLDDRVFDIATGIGPDTRNRPGKALLLRAAGFDQQGPKRGFTLPFQTWLLGPLRPQMRELVLSDDLPFSWLLDRRGREGLWRAFEGGHVHWSKPWAVGILRMWASEHGLRW